MFTLLSFTRNWRLKTTNQTIIYGAGPCMDDGDIKIIAGQATVGLEIFHQATKIGAQIDNLIVPCGGGGLIAGIGVVFSKKSMHSSIYSAEPAGYDDTARSLNVGYRVRNTLV